MIVLDTNVISELMKPRPSGTVLAWMDNQDPVALYITTVTIAEISCGIQALLKGRRRAALERSFGQAVDEGFQHRVLPLDQEAAYQYGQIMAARKAAGKPLSVCDGQIAAITLSRGFVLATRNTRDFSNCGLELINPFA